MPCFSRCHSSCKKCRGPAPNQCLSCNTDYVLQNGRCNRPCRDGESLLLVYSINLNLSVKTNDKLTVKALCENLSDGIIWYK